MASDRARRQMIFGGHEVEDEDEVVVHVKEKIATLFGLGIYNHQMAMKGSVG